METLSLESFLDQVLSIQWPVTPRTLAFSIRLEDERNERVGRDFQARLGSGPCPESSCMVISTGSLQKWLHL